MKKTEGGSSFFTLRDSFNSAATAGMSSGSYRNDDMEPAELKRAQKDYFYYIAGNDNSWLRHALRNYPQAVEWRNEEGLTGLMLAARHGHAEVTRSLLEFGANIEAINANGSTALTFAAFSGKAVVAEILLNAGAKVNHSNSKGHTPLLAAASQGNKNTVRLLLENGADPRASATDGATPISYAQENGFVEIAGMLTRRKQALDEKDAKDNAPVSLELKRPYDPANANPPPPPVDRDGNTRHMKELEKKMRNAGLF